MSDHIERHRSLRWANANAPSYQWGDSEDEDDGYEYENELDGEKSTTNMPPPLPDLKTLKLSLDVSEALEVNNVVKSNDGSIDNRSQPSTSQVPLGSTSKLVLSIDNMRANGDDDDDDDDDDDVNEVDNNNIYNHLHSKEHINHDDDGEDEFEDSRNRLEKAMTPTRVEGKTEDICLPSLPPITTTTLNNKVSQLYYPPSRDGFATEQPYTPTSEASFTSDADSIQYEPKTLNVKNLQHEDEISTIYDIHEEGLNHAPTVRDSASLNHLSQPKQSQTSSTFGSQQQDPTFVPAVHSDPPKLELNIDSWQKSDDNDDSSDDDWGYNGNNSDDLPEVEDVVKESVALVVDHQDSLDRTRTPELVSTNLPAPYSWDQSADKHSSKDSITFHNPETLDMRVSPSNTENIPDVHYNQEQDTQTRGLNIVKSSKPENQSNTKVAATDDLQDLIKEVTEASYNDSRHSNNDIHPVHYGKSADRQFSLRSSSSIRKPPPDLFEAEGLTENSSTPSLSSPNNRLVSGDYSNIADAVDSYMSDGPDSSSRIRSQTIQEDEAEQTDDNVTVTDGYSFEENSESIMPSNPTHRVPNVSIANPEGKDDDYDITSFTPPSIPGIGSGGSKSPQLSTSGEERPLVSRMSTMSNNTFHFGEWEPNTNNFRDAFIGHNDRDSVLPTNQNISEQYQNFTKGNTRPEDNESITSIPETVDARLPSIHEDNDNSTTHNWSQRDLTSTMTRDSILSDKPYTSPTFKEEKLTPLPSEDAVNLAKPTSKDLPQKYTSLLGAVDESTKSSNSASSPQNENATLSHKRSQSHGSITTTATSVSRVTSSGGGGTNTITTLVTNSDFKPKAYPVFNWKEIMAYKDPEMRIIKLNEALLLESQYDSGLQAWLNQSLHQQDETSTIQIGKIASSAYQSAAHSDIRRHQSLRSKVSSVKDRMENSGHQASSFGKRFFNRGKKLVNSTTK